MTFPAPEARAQKRVNALKYNLIPRYRATVQRIRSALEEDERSTLFPSRCCARKPA